MAISFIDLVRVQPDGLLEDELQSRIPDPYKLSLLDSMENCNESEMKKCEREEDRRYHLSILSTCNVTRWIVRKRVIIQNFRLLLYPITPINYSLIRRFGDEFDKDKMEVESEGEREREQDRQKWRDTFFHRSCPRATWADGSSEGELQSENPIRTLGKFETRARATTNSNYRN